MKKPALTGGESRCFDYVTKILKQGKPIPDPKSEKYNLEEHIKPTRSEPNQSHKKEHYRIHSQ